jgi:hypothetical protein
LRAPHPRLDFLSGFGTLGVLVALTEFTDDRICQRVLFRL